jgi:uncharacterized membrane protein YeaQ/YmgE (transglycosylase-associated protein family)
MLPLLLAVMPDVGKAIDIICGGGIVGLLVGLLAGILFKKLPNGLFPTLVLAPLGSIVPIWVGYQFEVTGAARTVCGVFVLVGPVLMLCLYGLVTKKRR